MSKVGRPVEHDQEVVLDRAMRALWKCGVRGMSVRDLVAATGLSSRSMYDRFGSKNGLLTTALERYLQTVLTPFYETLERGRGKRAVTEFFERFVSGPMAEGCLFANTLSERESLDAAGRRLLDGHVERIVRLMAEKIAEDGRTAPEQARGQAREAFVLLVGLNGARRALDARHLRAAVEDFLSTHGLPPMREGRNEVPRIKEA